MNKKEFIRECRLRGYCSAKLAREYTQRHKKDKYTEEDLRRCYEIDEERWPYDCYRNFYRNDCDKSVD